MASQLPLIALKIREDDVAYSGTFALPINPWLPQHGNDGDYDNQTLNNLRAELDRLTKADSKLRRSIRTLQEESDNKFNQYKKTIKKQLTNIRREMNEAVQRERNADEEAAKRATAAPEAAEAALSPAQIKLLRENEEQQRRANDKADFNNTFSQITGQEPVQQ
tara:strand:- start:107 stop:598 length:492 start_codon:yes stop_codon:yes gene_type:complete